MKVALLTVLMMISSLADASDWNTSQICGVMTKDGKGDTYHIGNSLLIVRRTALFDATREAQQYADSNIFVCASGDEYAKNTIDVYKIVRQ